VKNQATTTQAEQQGQDGVWVDKFGRVRRSEHTFTDDDGTVTHGAEANAAASEHFGAMQEHNRQVLAQLKPHELARFKAWLGTRTRDTPPVRPPSRPANGRAPPRGT
jgi:hypothetical protein